MRPLVDLAVFLALGLAFVPDNVVVLAKKPTTTSKTSSSSSSSRSSTRSTTTSHVASPPKYVAEPPKNLAVQPKPVDDGGKEKETEKVNKVKTTSLTHHTSSTAKPKPTPAVKKPEEKKPVPEVKVEEKKPAEKKPEEKKPAVEKKPEEKKPVVENKPAKMKPEEKKPSPSPTHSTTSLGAAIQHPKEKYPGEEHDKPSSTTHTTSSTTSQHPDDKDDKFDLLNKLKPQDQYNPFSVISHTTSSSTTSNHTTKTTKTKKYEPSAYRIYTNYVGKPKKQKTTKRPAYVPDGEPLTCYPGYLLEQKPKWWGTQTIPKNQCYTKKKNGCKDWSAHKCWVKVGEVQLLYFPPAPASITVNGTVTKSPKTSTMYDPVFEYTFTSPSVYVLFHSITAWAGCKGHPNTQLGPRLTSAFFPFALKDVSTLMPHKTYTGHGQTMGTRALKLKDIMSDCTMPFNRKSAIANTAPRVGDDGYRCYPRLAIPLMVRDFAHPWWSNCQIFSRKNGMIDPPYALTPGVGIATAVAPVVPDPDSPDEEMDYPGDDQVVTLGNPVTQASDDPDPTPAPAPNPAPVQVPDAGLPTPTPNPDSGVAYQSPDPSGETDLVDPPPAQQNNPPANGQPAPENKQAPSDNPPASGGQPAPEANANPDANPNPVGAVSVSVIATSVIAGPPPAQSIGDESHPVAVAGGIIPPQNDGAPGTPADSGTNPSLTMTVEPVPVRPSDGDVNFAIPIPDDGGAQGQGPNEEIGQEGSSGQGQEQAQGAQGANKVLYMGKTLLLNGPLATVTSIDAVLSYGSDGVIVQLPHGVVSTIPVGRPTPPPASNSTIPQNLPSAPPAAGAAVGPTTAAGAGKESDAGDIASMINFVVNGGQNPEQKPASSPSPPSSSSSLPSSVGNAAAGAVGGGNASNSSNSTSTDSTDDTVLFTGSAGRLASILPGCLLFLVVGVAVFL